MPYKTVREIRRNDSVIIIDEGKHFVGKVITQPSFTRSIPEGRESPMWMIITQLRNGSFLSVCEHPDATVEIV